MVDTGLILSAARSLCIPTQRVGTREGYKTDREYQLWEEGSHPQWIQNEAMLVEKLEYIHNNPVKRGYVDQPEHWRYSSARNYSGLVGLIPVYTEWWTQG